MGGTTVVAVVGVGVDDGVGVELLWLPASLWRCQLGRILRGEHAKAATVKEIWGWKGGSEGMRSQRVWR